MIFFADTRTHENLIFFQSWNFGNKAIIINQIPLLVESNHDYKFDKVIAISVSDQVRNERLLARGLSQGDIDRRISAQAKDAQREEISDFIIENSGDIEELKRCVTKIWHELVATNLEK